MRMVANVIHLRRRIHRSPRHVRRVFQAHQRRLRVVINLRPDDRLDLLPRQNPVLAQGHSRHAAGNRRHRSQLIQIHVASLFANHFVAVMRPHFDANEIPHAPGDSPSPLCSSSSSLLRERRLPRPGRRAFRVLCVNPFLILQPQSIRSKSHLNNSTNTSFETLNRPGASRTTPPSRSTKPAKANGSNRFASVTPYSRSIRPTSIPSNCRKPRNNASSSALSAVSISCCSTGNRPPCTAAT